MSAFNSMVDAAKYYDCECDTYGNPAVRDVCLKCVVDQIADEHRFPSRREQRLARKAAKNLEMYKTVGRRPWGSFKEWLTLTHPDGTSASDDYRVTHIHSIRMQDFREPSGFKQMSLAADKLKDNH